MIDGRLHGAEFLRCMIELDVRGAQEIWSHVSPHIAMQSPEGILKTLHMARIESERIAPRLKEFSTAWLDERGICKIDGIWTDKPVTTAEIAVAVGIACRSNFPGVAVRVKTAMEDALLNAMAKGITEPNIQRQAMLTAREKVRRKMALA